MLGTHYKFSKDQECPMYIHLVWKCPSILIAGTHTSRTHSLIARHHHRLVR